MISAMTWKPRVTMIPANMNSVLFLVFSSGHRHWCPCSWGGSDPLHVHLKKSCSHSRQQMWLLWHRRARVRITQGDGSRVGRGGSWPHWQLGSFCFPLMGKVEVGGWGGVMRYIIAILLMWTYSSLGRRLIRDPFYVALLLPCMAW